MECDQVFEALTDTEFAVVFWKCQGLTLERIALKFDYSLSWVQTESSRADKKLGLGDMVSSKRKVIYQNEICPALRKWIEKHPNRVKKLPEPVNEIEIPEIETTIIPVDPKPIPKIDFLVKRTGRNYWRLVLVGIFVCLGCSVVGVGAFYSGRYLNQIPTVVQIITATFPASSLSSPIPSPTITSVPTGIPTEIPLPIDTPTPVFVPPADGILFQDDFDNGFKPDWNLGDNWITSGGELTQTTQAAFQNYYSWATLNKPEWKNYILSVKINTPYQGSAAQSNVAVAVRVNGQEKYLGVQILPFVGNALFLIGRSKHDSDVVASHKAFSFDSGTTLQIEANGNNFIVTVDGRQVQQISMSGYESGGIALGIDCLSSLGCPTFDNVKVTYLP